MEAKMTKDELITITPLSTRAKRALAQNDIRTAQKLQALLAERGSTYIKTRMFGIGRVTADEILRLLGSPSVGGQIVLIAL